MVVTDGLARVDHALVSLAALSSRYTGRTCSSNCLDSTRRGIASRGTPPLCSGAGESSFRARLQCARAGVPGVGRAWFGEHYGNCDPLPTPRTQSASLENQSHWFATTFTALAWLFLLLPTGNPWYFLWALPWLIWARQTAWYLLPGLLAQYYLYFWFFYHYPEGGTDVLGTGWPGLPIFPRSLGLDRIRPFFAAGLSKCGTGKSTPVKAKTLLLRPGSRQR
jgi:hypothetical protein